MAVTRIDCDIHPAVGGTRTTLLPYLSDHWKEQVVSRAIDGLDLTFEAPSLDAWWERTLSISASTAEAVRNLAPAEVYRLRDAIDAGYAPYVEGDGSVALPGRVLLAAATA